jgi:transitional endoplasmic reticulum ATPase
MNVDRIRNQGSTSIALEYSLYSLLLYIPLAVIVYVWPEKLNVGFYILALAVAYKMFDVNWRLHQGLKEVVYIAFCAILYFFGLLLSRYFSDGKPEIWAIGGFIYTFVLFLFAAKYVKRMRIWAFNINKLPSQAQRQMQMSKNKSDNKEKVSSASDEFPARRPRFTFKDVHGMQELKDTLLDTVDHFKDEGGNGIMLSGEPGNGKTFVAEALAGQLSINFLEARTQELTSRWIGHTTEKIKEIFEAAKAQAPCVLFLDEIDSFLLDRGGDDMNQDQRQTVNTLLTLTAELNKGLNEHGVLVVAATNFIDKLDGAGIREGRFDKKIKIESPDQEARKGILLDGLHGKKVDDKMLDQVVSRWEGFSVARMRAIAKMAKKIAREENKPVDIELLSRALRETQGRKGANISEKALRLNDLKFTQDQQMKLDLIVNQIHRRHSIEANGGQIPKGAIFFGPPGAGKTTVVKALALEVDWAYLPTTGQALLHSPDEIEKMIRKASDIRPTIVFIDEAEGIIGDRLLNPNTKEITNKLLAVMDGDKPLHDVFFIAATNHPDDVDPAMMRWGRFSELLDFTPDKTTLKSVVDSFIEKRNDSVNFDGDIDALAGRMFDNGFAQADVIGCMTRSVNQALINPSNEGEKSTVNLDGLP